jgi:predicted dehydrogenase
LIRAQPSETVRIAMVGVGARGSLLLRHLLKAPGVRVVAICDLLPERAEQARSVAAAAGQNAEVFADFRKMLDARKDIDAVVQAVPDWRHKDVNLAILETGRHLYAEKPLALTPEDCRLTVNAARQAKGILQVGFQLRHDAHRGAAMRFIHSGGIGKVLVCHGMRHGRDLNHNNAWYFDRSKSGDMMVDQGIHILDLFTWTINKPPLRAMGSGSTSLFHDSPPGRTILDNYSLVLEYPSGMHVNFSHHYFDPPEFTGIRERVFGSLGAIDLQSASWMPREKGGTQKLEVPPPPGDATYMSLLDFAANVHNNNRNPLNDAASAERSTLVVLMGTRAILQKRIVTWEEIQPKV